MTPIRVVFRASMIVGRAMIRVEAFNTPPRVPSEVISRASHL
jgi:hypothetical protein